MLIGPFALFFLWEAAKMARDLIGGSVELVGTVTKMSAELKDEALYTYTMTVQEDAFFVTKEIYN